MTIEYKDLKKNDEVKTTQLGTPVSGKLIESPKQGRGLKKTILIWSKGSEIGMFEELDFQGNTVMSEFEGCNHAEHLNWDPQVSRNRNEEQ